MRENGKEIESQAKALNDLLKGMFIEEILKMVSLTAKDCSAGQTEMYMKESLRKA